LLRARAHESEVAVALHDVAQMPLGTLAREVTDGLKLVQHDRNGALGLLPDLRQARDNALERAPAFVLASRAAVDAEGDGGRATVLVELDRHTRRQAA